MIKIEISSEKPHVISALGRALVTMGEELQQYEGSSTPTAEPTATEPQKDEPTATEPQTNESKSPDCDHNGVAFNRDTCSMAAKPFYTSGKREGQWKRRQGVTEQEYDAWYARELAAKAAGGEERDETFDSSGAFGGQHQQHQQHQQQQHQQHQQVSPLDEWLAGPDDQVPAKYLQWVSEMQADGRLTSAQVTGAFETAELELPSLFSPPTPMTDVIENIKTLYSILSGQLG